jgi:hypothetical protein
MKNIKTPMNSPERSSADMMKDKNTFDIEVDIKIPIEIEIDMPNMPQRTSDDRLAEQIL